MVPAGRGHHLRSKNAPVLRPNRLLWNVPGRLPQYILARFHPSALAVLQRPLLRKTLQTVLLIPQQRHKKSHSTMCYGIFCCRPYRSIVISFACIPVIYTLFKFAINFFPKLYLYSLVTSASLLATIALLIALRYDLMLASKISVESPRPVTRCPLHLILLIASPKASSPSVTA